MPVYRIYRLKENQRQHFRWAPHTSGATAVKRKGYEEGGCVEAPSVYGAWSNLRETDRALNVGDLLEVEGSQLHIFKYVGFEEARWILPEARSELESVPPAAGVRGTGTAEPERSA